MVEKIKKLPSETVEPNNINININNIRTTHKTLLTTLLLSLTIIFSTPLAPHAKSLGATTSSPPNLVTPTQLFSKDNNFDFGSNPNKKKKKKVELDVESPSSTKKLKQLNW